MREIKFRVWDKQNMRYRDTEEFAVTGTGRLLHLFSIYGDYKEVDDVDRYEVEIGTGLKVKNSVELYKNDVIKYEGINGAIDRATVFWHSGFLSWMVNDGKGKGSISLCDLSTMLTDSDDGFVCDELEVIDNIHDNPELDKEA